MFTAFLGIASFGLPSSADDPIISSSDVVQTVKITFNSNGGDEMLYEKSEEVTKF